MFEDEKSGNNLQESTSIASKINNLTEWQEALRKGLKEKQEAQKRQLKLEHAAAYEQLGLTNHLRNDEDDDGDDELDSPLMPKSQSHAIDANNLDGMTDMMNTNNEKCIRIELNEQRRRPRQSGGGGGGNTDRSGSTVASANSQMNNNESEAKNPNPPVKNFLKKGDGLKQRFKVDPSAYKLDNLPKYKFANAHPHLRMKNPTKTLKLQFDKDNEVKGKPVVELDAQEKQFQKTLILSKNICSSTPDAKSSGYGSLGGKSVGVKLSPKKPYSPRVMSTKVDKIQGKKDESNNLTASVEETIPPPLAWSEVLNTQKDQVGESHSLSVSVYNEGGGGGPEDENETLNMFEYLEEQVKDGSVKVDKNLLACFWRQAQAKRLANEIDDSNLAPPNSNNNKDIDSSVRTDNFSECYTTTDDEDVVSSHEKELEDEKSIPGTGESSVYMPNKIHEEQSLDESSCIGDRIQCGRSSSSCLTKDGDSSVLEHFREVLFNLLNQRAQQAEADIRDDESAGTVTIKVDSRHQVQDAQSASTANVTLPEELNKVKDRNKELERELANFKEANKELVKLKQEFELEKGLFEQEKLDALKEMHDIRIKFEMYMHDERIKLEEERRKVEQQIRSQRMSKQNKDRIVVLQLKEEVDKLNNQIKQKDQNHAAAQARLRAQITKLEKDQKCLQDEIETLRKENKRLETECLRIEREKNNKLLDEINRNIAKLAPKVTATGASTGETPRGQLLMPAPLPTNQAPEKTKSALKKKGAVKAANTERKIKSPESKKVRPKKLEAPLNTPIKSSSSSDDEEINEASQKENLSPDSSPDKLHILKRNKSGGSMMMNNNQEEAKKNEVANEQQKQQQQQVPIKTFRDKMISFTPETFTRSTSTTGMILPPKPAVEEKKEKPIEEKKEASVCVSTSTEFNREIINPDGSKDIWYSNGNVKKLSADRMHIRMLYYNKDIKETDIEKGTVRYYYASTNTWHTTYLDGLEILEFPNGQTEHRFKNGVVEIHFPNHSVKVVDPNDKEVESLWHFEDGTELKHMHNGEKILILPNGQREVHTKSYKRREYPDGTVKIVYPDGSQETRYSNGRVRLKDKAGKLVMDSDNAVNY